MNHSLLLLALLILLTAAANAGEVTLRGTQGVTAAVVKLGDIADFKNVSDTERRQIELLPLFPAPRAGLPRRVTAQDVRETMSLYGISLPTLRVSGECRVEGIDRAGREEHTPSSNVTTASLEQVDPQQTAVSEAKDHVAALLEVHLQSKDRIHTEWTMHPMLSAEQAAAITAMQRPEVSGGQSPWTGRQVFSIRDRAIANSKPLSFKADVTRVARAVVTLRSLEPGDVITASDVELGEINPQSLSTTVVLSLDDAVGKEVKRATPAGQIVQTHLLQRPLLVKRGDLVTVYSIAAGVQVKATAKSQGDGAVGDVIQLDSSQAGKRFQARVTGFQEAMVFVDTPTVSAK